MAETLRGLSVKVKAGTFRRQAAAVRAGFLRRLVAKPGTHWRPGVKVKPGTLRSRVLHGSYFANLHLPVPAILKIASDPFSNSSTNYNPHPSRPTIN